jgi:hypothetical protein
MMSFDTETGAPCCFADDCAATASITRLDEKFSFVGEVKPSLERLGNIGVKLCIDNLSVFVTSERNGSFGDVQ